MEGQITLTSQWSIRNHNQNRNIMIHDRQEAQCLISIKSDVKIHQDSAHARRMSELTHHDTWLSRIMIHKQDRIVVMIHRDTVHVQWMRPQVHGCLGTRVIGDIHHSRMSSDNCACATNLLHMYVEEAPRCHNWCQDTNLTLRRSSCKLCQLAPITYLHTYGAGIFGSKFRWIWNLDPPNRQKFENHDHRCDNLTSQRWLHSNRHVEDSRD